jgi:hypothetical protein
LHALAQSRVQLRPDGLDFRPQRCRRDAGPLRFVEQLQHLARLVGPAKQGGELRGAGDGLAIRGGPSEHQLGANLGQARVSCDLHHVLEVARVEPFVVQGHDEAGVLRPGQFAAAAQADPCPEAGLAPALLHLLGFAHNEPVGDGLGARWPRFVEFAQEAPHAVPVEAGDPFLVTRDARGGIAGAFRVRQGRKEAKGVPAVRRGRETRQSLQEFVAQLGGGRRRKEAVCRLESVGFAQPGDVLAHAVPPTSWIPGVSGAPGPHVTSRFLRAWAAAD